MTINNWLTIIVLGSFVLVLIVKLLLDLHLGLLLVKYFSWIPLRNYFRENPAKLKGVWEIIWGAGGSEGFFEPTDRHGHPEIKQLGSYIYAEFYAKGVKYALFGRIQGEYIVGDWFDVKDKRGYFGVFQLEIVDTATLRGIWLGHSKHSRTIRNDELKLNRVRS
jgi:hypothetical protein